MRFSILTVTLNGEKYLEKTLASVASQTFTDFEHLLWDGGSTDRTLEIARKFPHVRIIEGKDEGISDAMNLVADHAKGQFLMHLHADDLLAHEKVLQFVDTALRQNPQTLWLYGLCDLLDEEGRSSKGSAFRPFCYRTLKKYNTISHPATFYSRDLFHKMGGFKKNLRYAMDYDLWLRFAAKTQPLAFAHVVAHFRKHEGSLSTALPLKVADECHAIRKIHFKSPLARWRSWRTWKKRRKACSQRC
jgi:glycosyltransferase involved in cell wall biosynthesis